MMDFKIRGKYKGDDGTEVSTSPLFISYTLAKEGLENFSKNHKKYCHISLLYCLIYIKIGNRDSSLL